jgi:predicted amidohydrolase
MTLGYLVGMFVTPPELEPERAALRAYAAEHAMVVAMANYGGPSGEVDAAGRSAIWSQDGELLVELGPTGTGVAVAREGEVGWRARVVSLGD